MATFKKAKNRNLCFAWGVGVVAIVLAYAFVDRPVAEFVYVHHWQMHLVLLKQVVEWPAIMVMLAPFLFLLSFAWRNSDSRCRKILVLMALSILVTYVLKNELKWVFSRYWPLTWTHNNLSWIGNHAYGFQWFQGPWLQGVDATGSFPSGHTAIAFATLFPIAVYSQRYAWFWILLATLEGISMVAFDYHFVSDVIAGALLAITCVSLLFRVLERQR